jgi:hypothetical protein
MSFVTSAVLACLLGALLCMRLRPRWIKYAWVAEAGAWYFTNAGEGHRYPLTWASHGPGSTAWPANWPAWIGLPMVALLLISLAAEAGYQRTVKAGSRS